MKIISEEVNSYFMKLENNKKKAGLISVMLKIDDEGQTVYLEAFFESVKNSVIFSPTRVRKEDLEDEENLANKSIKEDEEYDSGVDFKNRYSKMFDYIIEKINVEAKKENQEYDLENVRREFSEIYYIAAEDEERIMKTIEMMREIAREKIDNKNFEFT